MKSLILRRGLEVVLVGVVGLALIAAFHKPNDSSNISSDISSDSFRRLPKSQIPNLTEDHETDDETTDVMIHQSVNLNVEHLSALESRIGALQDKMDKVIALNFDDNQGKRYSLEHLEHQNFHSFRSSDRRNPKKSSLKFVL